MDDHRQVKLCRQRHLGTEGLLLALPGDVLIVVIQANLANGENFFVLFT